MDGGEGARNDNGSEGEGEGEGDGREGAGDDESVEGDSAMYDEEWQRSDRAEWTEELASAHAAFEVGRRWGKKWAACVQKFFDFEAAWGYVEGTWKMENVGRPRQVAGWLSRGRKWWMPPTLGEVLGTRQGTGEEELWVGLWWRWWRKLQPEERIILESGLLSRPETVDWSGMAQMHGNNGFLQVMAGLTWWGEVVQKHSEEEKEEWGAAVDDVTWVLEQLLESGDISK
jgi:hypothetical protein